VVEYRVKAGELRDVGILSEKHLCQEKFLCQVLGIKRLQFAKFLHDFLGNFLGALKLGSRAPDDVQSQ